LRIFKITFQKLVLFPSSGVSWKKVPTSIDPLETAGLKSLDIIPETNSSNGPNRIRILPPHT
jgi:hypothetical protein